MDCIDCDDVCVDPHDHSVERYMEKSGEEMYQFFFFNKVMNVLSLYSWKFSNQKILMVPEYCVWTISENVDKYEGV